MISSIDSFQMNNVRSELTLRLSENSVDWIQQLTLGATTATPGNLYSTEISPFYAGQRSTG
jgi:hypothetical protein